MRKYFLFMVLIATVLTSSGCANSTTTDPGTAIAKTYWTIDEAHIDREFEHAPKVTYNADGSLMTVFEAVGVLFGELSHDKRIYAPYEVVTPGSKQLEVNPEGVKIYFPDQDDYKRYESGEQIESLRMWIVFLDKEDEVWCWEYIGYPSSSRTPFNIKYPGPNLKLSVLANAWSSTWVPGNYRVAFLLATHN